MTPTRALEGLAAVLEKQPIIPTFKARDFWDIPRDVEAAYEQHVRSYIPLARDGEGEGGANVVAYEQKLTQAVKEARAPLGYITAEYGHGKTSTGLFLWESARNANILAVPPFSFDAMQDLVTAVAGWVRFAVERDRPGLGIQAEDAYGRYRREGIEGLARRQAQQTGRTDDQVLADLQLLEQQGNLILRLGGLEYVNFLAEMTILARQAGYQGLLVIADEVQQYLEHENVNNAREPIADLFDLITTMYTRTERLACGFIMLLPNKELGLINEQRGDLVQRVKIARLGLDLEMVFWAVFSTRLWRRLADQFGFADVV
jgi:hypothetical protein